jgi:hypothetical protein
MNVDPVDDCTFWYVNEWVPVTSSVGWQLRIGAFRFPDCAVTPSTVHVGDLDRATRNASAIWQAIVTVLVHDNGHAPVDGALVTFDVSGVGSRSCTTIAAGTCRVEVSVSHNIPSVTFTVRDVSKAGLTYNPGANHDPDGDSNGTVIVVNEP